MKAVFFDFDGLIVDTESAYREAWASALVPGALKIFDELATGKREEEAAQVLRPYFRENVSSDFVALEMKRAAFLSLMADSKYLRALPGIPELLASLSGRYRLDIVSNSSLHLVEGPLRLLGLRDFFEGIVCWTAETRAKPHPDLYLAALRKAAISPEEVVALEDSTTGLEAAIAAGITPVCIGTNDRARRFCRERKVAWYASADLLLDSDPNRWSDQIPGCA